MAAQWRCEQWENSCWESQKEAAQQRFKFLLFFTFIQLFGDFGTVTDRLTV